MNAYQKLNQEALIGNRERCENHRNEKDFSYGKYIRIICTNDQKHQVPTMLTISEVNFLMREKMYQENLEKLALEANCYECLGGRELKDTRAKYHVNYVQRRTDRLPYSPPKEGGTDLSDVSKKDFPMGDTHKSGGVVPITKNV